MRFNVVHCLSIVVRRRFIDGTVSPTPYLQPVDRNDRISGLLSPYPHDTTGPVMEQEHPIIAQFRMQAELMDFAGTPDGLNVDDLTTQMASWMWLIEDRLTEDDMAVLIGIGGALFREGLRQRLNQRLGL